jgi:predicted Fe-Mo cluster-binding NifX family protein
MNRIIGIPADGSELSDNVSPHFGHCNFFVGVKLSDDDKFEKLFSIANEGHAGCMEPVMNMKHRNVTDMILTGIGMRPFMGFQQVQINLYQGVAGTIEKNIRMLLDGQLTVLNDASCGAHSDHDHTHE